MAAAAAATTFTILYFAASSTYTSRASESLLAPLPISKLYGVLEERYPGITNLLKSCQVTVNLEYVDIPTTTTTTTTGGGGVGANDAVPELLIRPGDEVAIIPPVSSG